MSPENDAVEAAKLASADNHRLASIVEAADKLAKAIEAYLNCGSYGNLAAMNDALDAFKVVRQGQ